MHESKKLIGILQGFASGTTLGTVCFHFISEALHSDGDHEHSSVVSVVFFLLLGYAAVFLIDLIISRKTHHDHHEICHCHCEHCGGDSKKLVIAGFVMVCSIALHNLPIGMIIGTSSLGTGDFITVAALSTALAVTLHNIPEGMAAAVPFISGGMKSLPAILITASCGVTTVIGGIIGYEIGNISTAAFNVMLSLAAGAMLYVIFSELIPEALQNCKPKTMTVALMLGLMLSILMVFGGSHAHA